VVEEFPGAGFVGRGVAGAGGSIIRNASEGRPSLAHLIIPVGPVRLYIDRDERRGRVKLDLNTLVMTAVASGTRDLDFDVSSSLSAGAPVFRAHGHLIGASEDSVRASGTVAENVILLSDLPWRSAEENREIFAHERVHVLQRDQLFTSVAEPIGARIVGHVPALESLYRYLDFHLTDLFFHALAVPFSDYYDRPWELEAFHLARP
jgi:hypothetical protein